jgi:hypothetical protein
MEPYCVLPLIVAIEETFPGTIRTAENEFGGNALWFTLHLYVDHADIASDVGQYLATHGCNPNEPFDDRCFSWNTMARVSSAIERYAHRFSSWNNAI